MYHLCLEHDEGLPRMQTRPTLLGLVVPVLSVNMDSRPRSDLSVEESSRRLLLVIVHRRASMTELSSMPDLVNISCNLARMSFGLQAK